jgi:hypothetical protein
VIATTMELADRVALRSLVDAYADAADRLDAAGMARLFTPEATMVVLQRGTDVPLRELRGSQELETLVDGLRPFEQTQHLMVGHLAELSDPDTATGSVEGVAHHLVDRGSGTEDLVMHLRYEDSYVRTAEGWRFASRSLRIRWASWLPVEQEPLAV